MNVSDSYPPTKTKLKLGVPAGELVSPFLGFQGLYLQGHPGTRHQVFGTGNSRKRKVCRWGTFAEEAVPSNELAAPADRDAPRTVPHRATKAA
ncbi:hypothetical protein IscW_ISCW012015 [Ixodes scapularis]|uniref:Uncharacterized protein n=1 Tax=Ixodes scapularis TaxID=6945 RepID=B7QD40_IXOSC|nr:hypothetical protein IscW_ISCW012015 [Ixodes scapularis]|eukprot:XP_002413454.1 hypothetical protein IscW_ISCW012015 [Ixodes scapularis]